MLGGIDLTGKEFSITYKIDDSLGLSEYNDDNYYPYRIEGGPYIGVESPATVVFKVGNIFSYTFGPQANEYIGTSLPGIENDFSSPTNNLDFESYYLRPDGDTKAQLSYGKVGASNLYNSFFLSNDDGSSYVVATLSTFAPSVAASVPEPATWTMLIMGFGLIGAALRRRNDPRKNNHSTSERQQSFC